MTNPATTRRIDPKTTATLRVTVTDDAGAAVDTATVTADVYGPSGALVASGQALAFVGAGQYDLTIDAAWSTATDGDAIEGVYRAVVGATAGGLARTVRIPYRCTYQDI
jgi:hypothetical protein